MYVTITNFKKFNSRTDVKNPSWFRLEHSLFENHEFYDLNHTEKMVWIYLLCLASKKSSDTILLSWSHIDRVGNFKKKDFLVALEKLKTIQAITVDDTTTLRARNEPDTSAGATLHNNTEQNITNNTEQRAETALLDFEKIYEKYPRKEGKQKGLIVAKRDIRSVKDLELLEKAVEKYSAKVKRERTEAKFVKQFSTFMNSWRDWLEPDAGEVKFPKPKPQPLVSMLPEPDLTPFTSEQMESNKKKISELLNQNGLGGWAKK